MTDGQEGPTGCRTQSTIIRDGFLVYPEQASALERRDVAANGHDFSRHPRS